MTFESYIRNSSENNTNLINTLISKLLEVKSSENVNNNIKNKSERMWSSAELILKTITYFATEISKWEEKEESKACMFLFGMMFVVFCPILTISALFDLSLLFLIKVMIPTISVVLMLCVGLPTIAFMKWILNSYKFLCTITSQFCIQSTLIEQDIARSMVNKKERNIKKLSVHQFLGENRFSRNVPSFKEYEKYESTLEL